MSASGGNGYAKGRERREEILRVAGELFADRGYRGTSLTQIAQRAGLTDAGLLHHFPSKQSLLLAVLERRDEADGAEVRRAVGDTRTPIEALVELCRRNAETPQLVQLFTVMAAESLDERHPGHQAFVERYRARRRGTAQLLADAQRAGLVDPGLDPDRLAAQVLAMFDGLQLQWLRDPDAVDMVGLLDEFLARLRPAAGG